MIAQSNESNVTPGDFDLGDLAQRVPTQTLETGENIEDRKKIHEMAAQQYLLKQEEDRRAGIDVDAREQQERDRRETELQQSFDEAMRMPSTARGG